MQSFLPTDSIGTRTDGDTDTCYPPRGFLRRRSSASSWDPEQPVRPELYPPRLLWSPLADGTKRCEIRFATYATVPVTDVKEHIFVFGVKVSENSASIDYSYVQRVDETLVEGKGFVIL